MKSEEAVWEAVLRWVNYEPDARWQNTVKLMGSIRLGLLDTQVHKTTAVETVSRISAFYPNYKNPFSSS